MPIGGGTTSCALAELNKIKGAADNLILQKYAEMSGEEDLSPMLAFTNRDTRSGTFVEVLTRLKNQKSSTLLLPNGAHLFEPVLLPSKLLSVKGQRCRSKPARYRRKYPRSSVPW